jgi:DNA-binding NarL/FixJ family response regulator
MLVGPIAWHTIRRRRVAKPMHDKIKVLLIEHQPLTRLGIKTLLFTADDLDLIGEAPSPEDGFRQFSEMEPDVTVLGLRFPGSCSIDSLDAYYEEHPEAKILMLADRAGDVEIRRALEKGALGYVTKDVAPSDLLEGIRAVAKRRRFIPAEIASVLSEHVGSEDLTPAESKVLGMIVGGMSNKEIGFAMEISENTVKTHVQNIFAKLGVSDRTSAASVAMKRGLVRADI